MGFYYEFEQKEEAKKRFKQEALIWGGIVLGAILAAWLVLTFGLVKTTMFGNSMHPTLKDGNAVIVNRMSYLVKKPKRNDIIVFKQSGNEHSLYNIKRVIGLPGETIQIKDGYVYIDGEKLDEKFNFEVMSNGGLAEDGLKLDKNEFFVLGDNRNQSEDSRYANIGVVLKSEIVGRAWLRTNPFTFISKINEIDKGE